MERAGEAASEDGSRALAIAARVLRLVVLGLGATLLVLFVVVVVARFVYPIEVEWMTGAVRDAVARVRDGKPIYGPPSTEFISFLYPPLYYWLAGLVAKTTSTLVAAKVVSLAATLGAAWAIARVALRFGATRFWTAASVLLHFGAYSLTLFFYDLERVDALESALAIITLAIVLDGEGTARTIVAGTLAGLACFAKQPALFVLGALAFGLFVSGQRRRAGLFLGASVVVVVALAGYLHITTNGWFWFYCWTLPGAHGIDPKYVSKFFISDAPQACVLTGASVFVVIEAVRRVVRRETGENAWRSIVFGCVVAAALGSAFLLRAHRGGYPNVLLAWTPFGCAAVAVTARRLKGTAEVVLLAATGFQLLGWTFDPNDYAPGPSDARREAAFRAWIMDLERDGEVLLSTTGHVTKVPHFHSAAMFDIVDASRPPPEDYVTALETRRFAAIVSGAHDDPPCAREPCARVRAIAMRNYFVAAAIVYPDGRDDRLVGWDGRPKWVLRPRQSPLPPSTTERDLLRRHEEEISLAVMHGLRARSALPAPDDSIEQRAALAASAP